MYNSNLVSDLALVSFREERLDKRRVLPDVTFSKKTSLGHMSSITLFLIITPDDTFPPFKANLHRIVADVRAGVSQQRYEVRNALYRSGAQTPEQLKTPLVSAINGWSKCFCVCSKSMCPLSEVPQLYRVYLLLAQATVTAWNQCVLSLSWYRSTKAKQRTDESPASLAPSTEPLQV